MTDDEQALTGTTCTIGGTCGASVQLLAAASFPTGGPTRRRLDVAVTGAGTSNPRVIRQATTGRISFARGNAALTLKLRGALPNTPVIVDDLLLFEVIDGATGAVTAAAWAGGSGDVSVRRSGNEIPRLGKPGFSQDAGLVDLGSLLPRDKAFRLRVSALDLGGPTYVSDVYADIVSSAPPPPPPPAPWSVAACTGATITRAQVLARFAPGSTTSSLGRIELNARQRACQDLTGCGPWQPASSVPFNQAIFTGWRYILTGNTTRNIAVPAAGTAALQVRGNQIDLALRLDGVPLSTTTSTDGSLFSTYVYDHGPGYFVGSDTTRLTAHQLTNDQRVTNWCLYAESFGRQYNQRPGSPTGDGTYTEYHVVWSGRY